MKSKPSKDIRVWLSGSSGRMGCVLQDLIVTEGSGYILVGGHTRRIQGSMLHKGEAATTERLLQAWKDVDVVIDFSLPGGVDLLISSYLSKQSGNRGLPALLICTTGLSPNQIKNLQKIGENGQRVLLAPNTSIGILILSQLLRQAYPRFKHLGFDAAIVETHHKNKKDAPSGTAIHLRNTMLSEFSTADVHSEIPIQSVRGGQVFGEHEVKFLGEFEDLSFSHQACDRSIFGRGALHFSNWLLARNPGFYELSDVDI